MAKKKKKTIAERASDLENTARILEAKAALLRMRGEALNDIKSSDLLLKNATKNHKSEVLNIKKHIVDIDRKIKRCDKGELPKIYIPTIRRGRPVGSVNKTKRARNSKTLSVVIIEILKKNKGGLALPKIVLKVVESGYKSNTKDDFSKIVYQNLYKLQQSKKIKKDKNKKYIAKK